MLCVRFFSRSIAWRLHSHAPPAQIIKCATRHLVHNKNEKNTSSQLHQLFASIQGSCPTNETQPEQPISAFEDNLQKSHPLRLRSHLLFKGRLYAQTVWALGEANHNHRIWQSLARLITQGDICALDPGGLVSVATGFARVQPNMPYVFKQIAHFTGKKLDAISPNQLAQLLKAMAMMRRGMVASKTSSNRVRQLALWSRDLNITIEDHIKRAGIKNTQYHIVLRALQELKKAQRETK